MMSTREPVEIERDIANIDSTLLTVSEIRSSLKYFTELVQSDKKGPNFVHLFSDRLNAVKRDLNTLSSQGENLKGALEHAQIVANENKFNWALIKSEAEKEAAEEEIRFREEEANSAKAKETGSLVKMNAEYAYKQLSSIVLEQKPVLMAPPKLFFTTYIEQWISQKKPTDIVFTVMFEEEERITFIGSTCRIKICARKALVADLELEYERDSDSLTVHQYDIKGVKEEKNFWQDSQYLVFQKVNLLATDAFEDMLVFFAKESLYNMLDWFASYHDLFTAPCYRCHKILQFDSPQYRYLPPMVRTWAKKLPVVDNDSPVARQAPGTVYHMRCYIEYKNNHAM
ncbi:hypothetical protein MFLAVUS_007014 [Mucor flavus]|uniref:Uncharacterized protein n=1 Tax=Mucor flavus TaxID=439312 RepID=A0ABP9Z350_9FUNG